MLKDHDIPHRYREYTKEPLSEAEVRKVLKLLGVAPKAIFRKADRVAKELGLTGDEADEVLIPHMAEHPTLIQRPIGVLGDRAAIGRPPTNLLELV